VPAAGPAPKPAPFARLSVLPSLPRRAPAPARRGGPTSVDDTAARAGEPLPSTWLFEPKYGLPIVRRVS
jgi:hypothetical protein